MTNVRNQSKCVALDNLIYRLSGFLITLFAVLLWEGSITLETQ